MIRALPLLLACGCMGLPDGLDLERNHPNDPDRVPGLARCGNGVINTPGEGREGGEECDDGNGIDHDACRNDCTRAYCGDGMLRTDQNLETCDDGNDVDDDACTTDCFIARCGDGIVRTDKSQGEEGFEACDPGDEGATDECTETCQLVVTCGNGQLDEGDACECIGQQTCADCIDCQLIPCDDGGCFEPGAQCLRAQVGEHDFVNACLFPARQDPFPNTEEHRAPYRSCVDGLTGQPDSPNNPEPCATNDDCENSVCGLSYQPRDRGLCQVVDGPTSRKLLGFHAQISGHDGPTECLAMGCNPSDQLIFPDVGPTATANSCGWMRADDDRARAVLPLCLSADGDVQMEDGHQNVCVFSDCNAATPGWGTTHCEQTHGDIDVACSAENRCVVEACDTPPCEEDATPVFSLFNRAALRLTVRGLCARACGAYGAECFVDDGSTEYGVFLVNCLTCANEDDCSDEMSCAVQDITWPESRFAEASFRCLAGCSSDRDCPSLLRKERCLDGACVAAYCRPDTDCDPGEICHQNRCSAIPQACTEGACTAGSSCTSLVEGDLPFAVCLPDSCVVDTDCPALSSCTDGRCSAAFCGVGWNACADGTVCASIRPFCLTTACIDGSDCGDHACIAGRCLEQDCAPADPTDFIFATCVPEHDDSVDDQSIWLDEGDGYFGLLVARIDTEDDLDSFNVHIPEGRPFGETLRVYTRGTGEKRCRVSKNGVLLAEDDDYSGIGKNCLLVLTPAADVGEVTVEVRGGEGEPWSPARYALAARLEQAFDGLCGNRELDPGEACDSDQPELCSETCVCQPNYHFASPDSDNQLTENQDVPVPANSGTHEGVVSFSCGGSDDGRAGATVNLVDTTGQTIVFSASPRNISITMNCGIYSSLEVRNNRTENGGICSVVLPAGTANRPVTLNLSTDRPPNEIGGTMAVDYTLRRVLD
jgi:hypothetical protein